MICYALRLQRFARPNNAISSIHLCSTSSSTAANSNVQDRPLKLAFDLFDKLQNEPPIEKTNPLVLVHGLFGQKQNWRSIAKQIQRELGNFVFTVDMRNHGDSPHSSVHTYPAMAADLDEFVEKEVLSRSRFKKIFLLGHSMGGKVVTEFAMDSKKCSKIEKLIIEDVAPHRSSVDTKLASNIRAMKRVDLSGTRSEIGQLLKPEIPNDSIRTFLLTNLYKLRGGDTFHWRCNLDALEAYVDQILGYYVFSADSPNRKAPNCPILFISGQNSTYLVKEDQEELKRLFPRAKFQEIKGAGHWVHSEKPTEFIQVLLNFLQSGYFTYDND